MLLVHASTHRLVKSMERLLLQTSSVCKMLCGVVGVLMRMVSQFELQVDCF